MFSLASENQWRISLGVSLALIAMGRLCSLWYAWGVLLFILTMRFRHPPIYDRWRPLDSSRRAWAVVALMIFALCFTPWPVQ